MNIQTYLTEQRRLVEQAMEQLMLPKTGPFAGHIEAMRYSLFVGGKRVRPILCLAAASAVNDSAQVQAKLMPIACALECIHTYSLIHDDLPAMDDDDLRRGKPTSHKIYGEAEAILAGDSLLSWAFDLMSNEHNKGLGAEQRIKIINVIAKAIGPYGMVGGQYLDIIHENQEVPVEMLRTIHRHKTGALITGAVLAGGIGADASPDQLTKLQRYGDCIGLAFQIIDDLLNVTSTAAALGKAAGSDAERGKATYPAFFGIEETRRKARQAVDDAIASLDTFQKSAEPLCALAEFVYTRSN